MGAEEEISSEDEGARVGRRGLLKGAVAAGVGVVAWNSPSITSLAGTPAYAAVCTGGSQTFVINYRNTACNCGSNPNKYASYKDPYNENSCAVDSPPRQVAFHQGNSTSYPLLNNSGTCPPDPPTSAEGAYARIHGGGGSNDFEFCRLRVDSVSGNCSTDVLATAFSDIVPKGSDEFVAMPRVPCQGGGNIFLRISLECANDDACLLPVPTP